MKRKYNANESNVFYRQTVMGSAMAIPSFRAILDNNLQKKQKLKSKPTCLSEIEIRKETYFAKTRLDLPFQSPILDLTAFILSFQNFPMSIARVSISKNSIAIR